MTNYDRNKFEDNLSFAHPNLVLPSNDLKYSQAKIFRKKVQYQMKNAKYGIPSGIVHA